MRRIPDPTRESWKIHAPTGFFLTIYEDSRDCTLSSKNNFAIFSWAAAVGSKWYVWAVTTSMWAFSVSMGAVAGAVG